MKFLIDENIGKSVVCYLRGKKHDVVWIKELQPGMDDLRILKLAFRQKRVIVTHDQDFGEFVFLEQEKHAGVLLLKLSLDSAEYQVRALKNFLTVHTVKDISHRFHKISDMYL